MTNHIDFGPWSPPNPVSSNASCRDCPTRQNFVKIVEFNERGQLPIGDVTDLEAGANRCAVS